MSLNILATVVDNIDATELIGLDSLPKACHLLEVCGCIHLKLILCTTHSFAVLTYPHHVLNEIQSGNKVHPVNYLPQPNATLRVAAIGIKKKN